MNEGRTSPLVRIAAGVGTLASTLLVGAILGLVYVKIFVPLKAMGWDGIADALGSLMFGGLAGVVVGIALIALVSVRAQLVGIATAVTVAVITVVALAVTAPEREVSPPPVIEKDFQPFFRVGLRVTHTEEILRSVPREERPLPFTEVKLSTSQPEFIRVGWGPDFERCAPTPSRTDLEALVPRVRAAIEAAGPLCRTQEDDLITSFTWRLEGTSGNQSLQAGCLADAPALRALADALDALANRLCAEGTGAVTSSSPMSVSATDEPTLDAN